MIRKEELLESINDLPTLPAIVQQLRQKLADSDASATDIAKIVTNDVAISAKILKLVNSAYYGLERKVDSIQHAVAYLGFRNIYNLVLNLSVFKIFSNRLSDSGFIWRNFWLHCIATGDAARAISSVIGFKDPDAAFTAGLIHDLGKLVLGYKFPKVFEDIITYAKNNEVTFLEAEKKIIPVDHTEIGYLAAGQWNIPQVIQAAIHHHHITSSRNRQGATVSKDIIVDIVLVSDVIVQKLNIGSNGSYSKAKFEAEPLKRIGISKQGIEQVRNILEKSKEQMESFLGAVY